VNENKSCPLPGGIGAADYGSEAATASRGIGHDGIRSNYALAREGGSSMNVILKVILAVYNFFVGDLVILLGITLTMVILALIYSVGALVPLRGASGLILIVGVLATRVATLGREVASPENKQRYPR
jgi:hypothetical protein